jgi:hypothetical protein
LLCAQHQPPPYPYRQHQLRQVVKTRQHLHRQEMEGLSRHQQDRWLPRQQKLAVQLYQRPPRLPVLQSQ